MKIKIKNLLVIILIPGLVACSTPLIGTSSNSGEGLGAYNYSANTKGCLVSANTIKGGPDAECIIKPDGSVIMTVSPSQQRILTDIIKGAIIP